MRYKNIAITGGLGFIGSNLAIELAKLDVKVDIYDVNIHKNSRVLKELEAIKNVKLHDFDINIDKFEKPTDLIFNLACPASPPVYQKLSLLHLIPVFLEQKLFLNTRAKVAQPWFTLQPVKYTVIQWCTLKLKTITEM